MRPVIPVRIIGPRAEARWDALVDSGADETLLPDSIAELLGVDLRDALAGEAVGVSGEALSIRYANVGLRIEHGGDSVAWQTPVGFTDFGASGTDELVILGHAGCLDYFTTTLDGEKAELELLPNSILPSDEPLLPK